MKKKKEVTIIHKDVQLLIQEPEEQDIINALATKGFHGNMPEKKAMICPIINNKADIVTFIEGKCHSAGIESDSLIGKFGRILPPTLTASSLKTNANKYKIAHVAKLIYDLHMLWDDFRSTPGVQLNRSADQIAKFFKPLEEAYFAAERKAYDVKTKETRGALLSQEKYGTTRCYLTNGGVLPAIEALHFCPVCNHCSIDEPASNNAVRATNNADMAKWIRDSQEYQLKLTQNTLGPNEKKPPRPKGDVLLAFCHCFQMKCVRGGGGSCRFCPTGPQGDDVSGKCTCEVCNCPCKIIFDLRKCHLVRGVVNEKADQEAFERRAQQKQQGAALGITQMLNEAVGTTLYTHLHQAERTKELIAVNELRDDACAHAARRVTREAGHYGNFLHELIGNYGAPGTKVQGVQGETIDALAVGRPNKKRNLNDLDGETADALFEEQMARATKNSLEDQSKSVFPYGQNAEKLRPQHVKPAGVGHVKPAGVGGPVHAASIRSRSRSPTPPLPPPLVPPGTNPDFFSPAMKEVPLEVPREVLDLCSTPSDCSDQNIPRPHTPEHFADLVELEAHRASSTQHITLDGAELDAKERTAQEQNTIAYNQILGLAEHPFQNIPRATLVRLAGNMLRDEPNKCPKEGFEEFKRRVTYPYYTSSS